MSNQKSKKKTGLNVTSVSKDHWSNGGGKPKVEGTRLVVTILNGKGLLASDVVTGKSDPICFLWCGLPIVSTASKSAVDEFMDVTDEEECAKIGILRTKVCPTTLEPVWNEDIVFPLAVDDTYSLAQLRCLIYVRDEDIDDDEKGDDTISYDELGMCEISIKDILMYGKPLRTSIAYISKQLDLKSSPKMKKSAEGYIKVTCTLIFDEADTQRMYPEIGDGIKSLDVFLQKFQQILRGNFCFCIISAFH
jgi:C2 domain